MFFQILLKPMRFWHIKRSFHSFKSCLFIEYATFQGYKQQQFEIFAVKITVSIHTRICAGIGFFLSPALEEKLRPKVKNIDNEASKEKECKQKKSRETQKLFTYSPKFFYFTRSYLHVLRNLMTIMLHVLFYPLVSF